MLLLGHFIHEIITVKHRHLAELLQSRPGRRAVREFELVLSLFEVSPLRPQTLLRSPNGVSLQMYSMPEELQLGAALELLPVGKGVPQMVGVSLSTLWELIFQILQLQEKPNL